MKTSKRALIAGSALMALAFAGQASAETLSEAIAGGKLIFESRLRYETVDQTPFASNAEAVTLRTKLGWESASWNGLKGLVEFEDVRNLGADHYNDGVPPAEAFPVIADPEVTELNRLQVMWTASPSFTATLGRQRINLDDQRFVGGVGWRQDEQTFDALRLDAKVGPVKLTGAYVDQVNRIFAEALDYDSDSWLFNASVATGSDLFTPTAFVYALDFTNAAAASTITTGVKVTGKAKAGDVAWAWSGTYASQDDYGSNPANYTLGYWGVDLSATLGAFTLKGAYESLEGDGVRGFATPLATLHAFQGWADVFLTTPANGVEDASIALTYKAPFKADHFSNLALTAIWRDFKAQRTGADLGDELDLQATASITPKLSVIAKYADYQGVPGLASRDKIWLGVEFKH